MQLKIRTLRELYTPRQWCEAIIDHHRPIADALNSVGGWKELFNVHSHIPHNDRWNVIQSLKELLNTGLDGLIYLYAEDCHTEYNSDNDKWKIVCITEIPRSVWDYAQYYREAEDYLQRCKHPLFRRFASFNAGEEVELPEIKPEEFPLLLLDTTLPEPSTEREHVSKGYDVILPPNWTVDQYEKFAKEFFESLSPDEAPWESMIGGHPSPECPTACFPLAITSKVEDKMREVGFTLLLPGIIGNDDLEKMDFYILQYTAPENITDSFPIFIHYELSPPEITRELLIQFCQDNKDLTPEELDVAIQSAKWIGPFPLYEIDTWNPEKKQLEGKRYTINPNNN